MTKREAIRECKRFWRKVIESGLSKDDFLKTDEGNKWRDKGYNSNCPLCEYMKRKDEGWACKLYCPLYLQYKPESHDDNEEWGYCFTLGFDNDDPKAFYEYVRGLKE